MATDPIRLAQDAHSKAFRALADWLMADGELRRVVRTWRVWTGDQASDALPTTGSQLPWVRLTPTMGPITPFARRASTGVRVWATPLSVAVEVAVPGSDAADTMKIWGRIFDRVMAWTPEAFRAVGVSDRTLTGPAQAVNELDYALGKGAIALDMYLEA